MREAELSKAEIDRFIKRVWQEGERLYRDFPWRNIDDPYQVLVSEIMLQQTQVNRVVGYWDRFLKLFPTIDALASAETALVLEQWQGLGYNRRALALKRCAEICSENHQGSLPESYDELLALPGIGPATAAGVCAFAYQVPSVYLETNVRAVFIHELFPTAEMVRDTEIQPLVEKTCSQENPRAWYYALLDYGAYLKQGSANPSRKSAHYARQSRFEGSRRQKRAEILRCVLAKPGIGADELYRLLNDFENAAGRAEVEHSLFESILEDLLNEDFFHEQDEGYFA